MRRIRNKFRRPKVPWDSARIKEEKAKTSEYGLRRKKEIRVAEEILRNFRRRTRELIAVPDERKERVLLEKLTKLGLLKEKGAGLDDVLALSENDVLERRLQTVVFRKEMAKTPRQARQHIVHGHIEIDGRRTDVPSYLVSVDEESKIKWHKGFKPKEEKPAKAKRGVVKKPEEEKEHAPEETAEKAE
jgi:small subunit ribosomal protein S4